MRIVSLTLIVIISVTKMTLGQSDMRIIATYERNVIARPFFVRWTKNLIGLGFGTYEKLQLKSDHSFYYSYRDRYCGTFDNEGTGTWTKINDKLVLKPGANV